MAALPYIQLYVADYLADTAHLSTLENGAYLLLIFNYWQRGESFQAKDEQTLNKRLSTVARLTENEWASVKETLSEFFEVSENEWKHSRIDRDLYAVNSKSQKASQAGKASAANRANKRSTNAEQTFNHTDTDTDTDTDTEHKKQYVQKVSRINALDDGFHEFWNIYPKKVGKEKAKSAWNKAKPKIDFVLQSLSWQITSSQWTKQSGQFIPNPATYINEGRWQDEPVKDDFINQPTWFVKEIKAGSIL